MVAVRLASEALDTASFFHAPEIAWASVAPGAIRLIVPSPELAVPSGALVSVQVVISVAPSAETWLRDVLTGRPRSVWASSTVWLSTIRIEASSQ
ncbi:hypothetical protein D3C80_1203230 [compost metagenome]